MATVVRLTRMGRKKAPFYRIVVTDSRKRRDSGWIESIGYYNPMVEPEIINLNLLLKLIKKFQHTKMKLR